jgi:hypothetical protein
MGINKLIKFKKIISMEILAWIAAGMLAFGGFFAALVTMNFRKNAIELSEATKNILTGGESYPTISVGAQGIGDGKYQYNMKIDVNGLYPLRDLKIEIIDRICLEEKARERDNQENKYGGRITDELRESCMYFINFGDVYPISSGHYKHYFIKQEIVDAIFATERHHVFYQATMRAENGTTVQTQKIMEIWGGTTDAIMLSRNSEFLYDRPDEDFPRTQEGKTDWSVPID